MSTDLAHVPCVILCGGQGTRLRDISGSRPKPMVEIGDRPILWHIMSYYASFGVRRFVLALGHQGAQIADYFANYRLRHRDLTMSTRDSTARLFHGGESNDIEDWEITLAHTGEDTMTGGRIKRVQPYVQGELFFATYGDGVSNVDLAALYRFHQQHQKVATLTGVEQPTTFGVVESDEPGIVRTFREKPTLGGCINGGFFVFNRQIFDEIAGDHTILEGDPFRALIAREELVMYRHDGFWHCMDHQKDYATLNALWSSGRAPWRRW